MGFEFFKQSGRGFRPRASIRKQGQLGLNQGAVKRFDLNNYQYTVLAYDKDEKLIGLKLTNDMDEPGAQRILIKDGSASISARSFLEYFDIDYRDKTRQFDVKQDDESKMLIISIEKDKNIKSEDTRRDSEK